MNRIWLLAQLVTFIAALIREANIERGHKLSLIQLVSCDQAQHANNLPLGAKQRKKITLKMFGQPNKIEMPMPNSAVGINRLWTSSRFLFDWPHFSMLISGS